MSREANFHLGGCSPEYRNYNVSAPVYHGQCVMLNLGEFNSIVPWDGVSEQSKIGYVRCPSAVEGCENLYLQPGDCVDVRIERPLGGRGSGEGGDVACDIVGWFCDESLPPKIVWYTKTPAGVETFTKSPNSTDPVAITGCLKPLPTGGIIDNPTDMITGSKEELTFTTTATGLQNIPPDATGAVMQITDGCMRFTVDGSTPTPTSGYELIDPGTVNLGCLTSDNSTGDVQELSNFLGISENSDPVTLTITYYKKV